MPFRYKKLKNKGKLAMKEKKAKLKLEDIKVESFVTSISSVNEIVGGIANSNQPTCNTICNQDTCANSCQQYTCATYSCTEVMICNIC